MVVCGKGGEVFMVPTQQEQRKPKRPTHKDPGILLMVLKNGVMRGSHGYGRAEFSWMYVRG